MPGGGGGPGREVVEEVIEDGGRQGVPVGEVAVESGGRDSRAARDLAHQPGGAGAAEHRAGRRDDGLAVAPGVAAPGGGCTVEHRARSLDRPTTLPASNENVIIFNLSEPGPTLPPPSTPGGA